MENEAFDLIDVSSMSDEQVIDFVESVKAEQSRRIRNQLAEDIDSCQSCNECDCS